MPARRVRQVERKAPERRREFVQDLTGDAHEALNPKPEIESEENSFAAGAGSND